MAYLKKEWLISHNGVELPKMGKKTYVDPSTYDRPEDAICEFATEIDASLLYLETLIGGGEFGDVYKGSMTGEDGKKFPIAVKTLKEDATQKSEKDFLLEASVMGQFDCPNVIKLIGVVTKYRPWMIVIEFMCNGSLDNFLKANDGRLSHLELINMAKDVAVGMKYLSGMNFVHRDLAARNVLVDGNLVCKVSDFGLSRELEATDSSRGEYATTGGKIPIKWTALEAIKYRKFSTASDVWSFGILLWEIMSFARRLYWGWDNFKVIEEVDNGYRLPPPPNCPEGVYELMLYCWKADRSERPRFAQITDVIDQWIRYPETLDDEITCLTPIADGEADMEYATPYDLTHFVLTDVDEKRPNDPRDELFINDLVYVIPLDDQTKSQEGSIAKPEKRGTKKDDSPQSKLLEDYDGYLLPADGETDPSENTQISDPSAYAKLNESARNRGDMENTGKYQKLLKRDSDYVIPADGESASGRKVQTLQPSAYTELDKNRKNGTDMENDDDYQKLLKPDSDFATPDNNRTEKHKEDSILTHSVLTEVDEKRPNNPRNELLINDLVYVIPLDDQTKSQEGSIAKPEKRGTKKDDSLQSKLLEDYDGYLSPADGETDPCENAQMSDPSAYAKLNESARNRGDMENTGNYQKLLKRDSDYVIPADGESASGRKVQTLEPSAYTELDKNRKNGTDMENDDDYQKRLKPDSDFATPDNNRTENNKEDSILTHSVLTEVDEKRPNDPRDELLINDLVYVIPLDDQTKSQEGSIVEPEKRGTKKDDSLQSEL